MSRVIKQAVITIFAAAVAVVCAACGTTGSGSGASAENVAATVNGKEIRMNEIDAVINQQARGQQSPLSPLELAAARLQVLEDLIKQEVLFQRAEKEGLLPKEEEITQAINEQKVQNGMTEEQYQKMLKDNNQTEQQLRDIARKTIAVKRLLDRVGSKVSAPTEKEVEDFYNNNKQRYVSTRGVGLAAIVVDPADNGATDDAKGEAEAKQKIDIIYQRLKSGADFATVARERSEDQSNLRGGDIGFFSEEQLKQMGLPAELVAQFFNTMQTGDITSPQHVGSGQWYILKLTAKRLQTENLTLDNPDVRKDITDGLVSQRKRILSEALLQVAMSEAKVDNKLAADIVTSPDRMGGLRPVTPGASPAASPATSPAASPAATTAPSPQASASPTASPAASATATPKK